LGDKRTQVQKILGKRLWRLGFANGLTYDVYQYVADRPANPVLGVIGFGLDYLSLGLTEFAARDLKDFDPVKQVCIAYDDQDRVSFISKPLLVKVAGPCRHMRALWANNSDIPLTAKPFPDTYQVDSETKPAILKLDRGVDVTIDGQIIKESEVELSPGIHKLSYNAELGGSIMYGAAFLQYNNVFGDFELFPGRRYRLNRERFYPGQARVDIFWIEDVESGETLKCSQ
jgi:hypothetical protein